MHSGRAARSKFTRDLNHTTKLGPSSLYPNLRYYESDSNSSDTYTVPRGFEVVDTTMNPPRDDHKDATEMETLVTNLEYEQSLRRTLWKEGLSHDQCDIIIKAHQAKEEKKRQLRKSGVDGTVFPNEDFDHSIQQQHDSGSVKRESDTTLVEYGSVPLSPSMPTQSNDRSYIEIAEPNRKGPEPKRYPKINHTRARTGVAGHTVPLGRNRVNVHHGTREVTRDIKDGASNAITWEKYNGVRRSKFTQPIGEPGEVTHHHESFAEPGSSKKDPNQPVTLETIPENNIGETRPNQTEQKLSNTKDREEVLVELITMLINRLDHNEKEEKASKATKSRRSDRYRKQKLKSRSRYSESDDISESSSDDSSTPRPRYRRKKKEKRPANEITLRIVTDQQDRSAKVQ